MRNSYNYQELLLSFFRHKIFRPHYGMDWVNDFEYGRKRRILFFIIIFMSKIEDYSKDGDEKLVK